MNANKPVFKHLASTHLLEMCLECYFIQFVFISVSSSKMSFCCDFLVVTFTNVNLNSAVKKATEYQNCAVTKATYICIL